MLSPWVRLRLLPEWKVCRDVLTQHSPDQAAKFIDEVCWRTYFKGWLEGRPRVWTDYLDELDHARRSHGDDPLYQRAIAGQSGIDCLDAWTCELRETGYLHNHARMWYASIWTHTLKLPWTLGAAFFLTHLLDGDAASNTLGWRWVTGLHTNGKYYLANKANIRKFSEQEFQIRTDLAETPVDLSDYPPKPPYQPIPKLPDLPSEGGIGLLLHDDDLSAAEWLAAKVPVTSQAALFPASEYAAHQIHERVRTFRREGMRSVLGSEEPFCEDIEGVCRWAESANLQHVVTAQPFVGFWDSVLPELTRALDARSINLTTARHAWDSHFFPHAKAGFFRFKTAIPAGLKTLQSTDDAS
jgi:deoxyribodipyrimidine photo-lyase